MFSTRANGKLLLTSEYFILDGAVALAIPTRFGQSLEVSASEEPIIRWQSLDEHDNVWFEASFDLPSLQVMDSSDTEAAQRLVDIFQAIRQVNSQFIHPDHGGMAICTHLDFPRQWGLGTSSTLIAALSKWAGIDPYPVLFSTFGGSGYDLACAYANGPILYDLSPKKKPHVQEIDYKPAFSGQLYFIYLGQKQNSREGIARYREQVKNQPNQINMHIERLNELTQRWLNSASITALQDCMMEHEAMVSACLGLPKVKDLYFSDFQGAVKSLGAWGGDFVLAAANQPETEVKNYFREKGFSTVLTWDDMTLAETSTGRVSLPTF